MSSTPVQAGDGATWLPAPGHRTRWLLVTGCALLHVLSFPPVGWRWIIIPSLVGLLHALQNATNTEARRYGFVYGIIAHGISLYWFWNIFGAFSLALFGLLALFMSLFCWMYVYLQRNISAPCALGVMTAGAWVTVEFFRSEHFWLCFSWATPGLAIGPNPLLPWVGVYGVSFVLVLACAWLMKKSTTLAGTLILGAVAFGSWQWQHGLAPITAGNPVRVAAIQHENVDFNTYLESTEALPKNIQLVVWPELALPYDLYTNKHDWDLLHKFVDDRHAVMVVGTMTDSDKSSEWRNTALTFDEVGRLGEHYKNHVVHFMNEGKPGTKADAVTTQVGVIGTPICFDNDFEDVPRRMTRDGAQFFASPVMDVENWSALQHEQHAELFRIRAAENARWYVVAATSGVSQIIDSMGRVRSRLDTLTSGVLTGEVGRQTGLTFYTRFGWLFPWMISALYLAITVNLWIRRVNVL